MRNRVAFGVSGLFVVVGALCACNDGKVERSSVGTGSVGGHDSVPAAGAGGVAQGQGGSGTAVAEGGRDPLPTAGTGGLATGEAGHSAVAGGGVGGEAPVTPQPGALLQDCGNLAAVELTSGCGDAQERVKLCLEKAPVVRYGTCVRQVATGRVYFAAGTEMPARNWTRAANPLAGIAGFTPCTGEEKSAGFCLPASEASRQQVVVHVANSSAQTRNLVVGGRMCNRMRIERLEGQTWVELPLSTDGSTCECGQNCDGGPSSSTTTLLTGAAFDLVWDARVAELVDRWEVCADVTTCAAGSTSCEVHFPGAVLRPAPAGRYRITVGVNESACAGGSFASTCGAGWIIPGIHKICPASTLVPIEFELPASGDVTIPLALE